MANLDFVGELYSSARWSEYFNEATPLEYIGNLEAFAEYAGRSNLLKDIFRIFGKRVSLSSVINALTGIPLMGGQDKTTILTDLFDAFDKHDARRTLTDWSAKELRRATREGRSFTSVSHHYASKNALFDSKSIAALDSKFVFINAAICRKEHLRHNSALYEQASHSAFQWVLCDFPPLGMSRENEFFKGQLVFIELDPGFEEVFGGRVPFDPEIGWFPYCTIAGFFSSRKLNSENFPTVRMSLLFQRRPVSPEPDIDRIVAFMQREHSHLIYLKDLDSRVILYYLVPMMYKAWGISYKHMEPQALELLRTLFLSDQEHLNRDLVQLSLLSG